MWVPALLALLLCAVCFSLCSESPLYHFVDKNLTWSEAQQFCRQHFSDLACVSSSEDNVRLPRPPGYSGHVWIGLYDDPADLSEWKWTATNSSASFVDWNSTPPPLYTPEPRQCGVSRYGFWITSHCTAKLKGTCYSGSSPKVYHETPHAMNWDEALTYCRTHHTDLAFIENEGEDHAAFWVGNTDGNWIGLVRSTGKWSDNRAVTFRAWHRPSAYQEWREPFCAAENENNNWEAFSCQERRPFYCQVFVEPKSYRYVKMKFSGLGLEDQAINQQILDEIQKRFEAAGHTDVKIKWKTALKKQREEKKEQPEDCPTDV